MSVYPNLRFSASTHEEIEPVKLRPDEYWTWIIVFCSMLVWNREFVKVCRLIGMQSARSLRNFVMQVGKNFEIEGFTVILLFIQRIKVYDR